MAKVTAQEIIALGFKKELFKIQTDPEFEIFIDEIIAEQSLILEGRIGSSLYASATSPTKDYVKRSEKCLVAAEVVQRRINIILSNIVGSGVEIDVTHEGAQKKAYLNEAEDWIQRLLPGDFASDVLITSHFDETSISGEEQNA